jgi:hypothetical protein
VAKAKVVERERKNNLYFSAIGFIHDVKKGPFWEHSPILYDISGIRDGWGKINKVRKSHISIFPCVEKGQSADATCNAGNDQDV